MKSEWGEKGRPNMTRKHWLCPVNSAHRIGAFISVFIVVLAGDCSATDLPGQYITGDTTWDVAGSPYNLRGNIYVRSGATLTIQSGVQVQGSALYINDSGNGGALSATGVTFNNNVRLYPGATVSLSGNHFISGQVYIAPTLAAALVGNSFPVNSTVNITDGYVTYLTSSATLPAIANVSTYNLYGNLYVRNGAILSIANGNTIGGDNLYVNDSGNGGALSATGVTFNNNIRLYPGATVSLSGNHFISGQVYIAPTLATALVGNSFPANSTVNITDGYVTYLTRSAILPAITNVSTYNLYGNLYVRNGAILAIASGNTIGGDNLYVNDDGNGGALSATGVTFNNNVRLYPGATVSLSGNHFISGQVYIAPTLATALVGNSFPANSTVNITDGYVTYLTSSATLPAITNVSTYNLYGNLYTRNGAILTIAGGNTIGGDSLYVNDDGNGGALSATGVTFNNNVRLYPGATLSLSGNHFISGQVYIAPTLATALVGNSFPANSTVNISDGYVTYLTRSATLPAIANVSTYNLYGNLYVRNGAILSIANGNALSGSSLYVNDNGTGGTLLAQWVTFNNQLMLGSGSSGRLEFDTFKYSGYNYFDGHMLAIVTNNNFMGSRASAQGTGGPINLRGNYWGTTDSAAIAQNKIWDYYDSSYLPVIDFGSPLPAAPAPGSVQFSSSAYSTNEDGGAVTIMVTRTGGSVGAASVNYATADGTATAGSDYTTANGTLYWANGDATPKTFIVAILDDATYEGNEAFVVNLSGSTVASLGSPASATVTITEDPVRLVVLSAHGGTVPPTGTNTYERSVACWAFITNSPVILGTTQYCCGGWTGTGSAPPSGSTTNTGSFSVTSDSTLMWLWTTNYWLNTATNGNGTVNAPDGWWPKGSNAQITATAGDHHHFTRWTGQTNGCAINGNVITVPMTTPRAIAANFTTDQHSLIVTTPYGKAFPAAGTNWCDWNSPLTAALTNSPVVNGSTQYVCTGWTGAGSVPASGTDTNIGPFAVTNNSSIAWLWATNYWLDTATNGNGNVDVNDQWCRVGSNIVITARPAAFNRFKGWTGQTNGCTIASNQITALMNSPRTITANFVRQYSLSVATPYGQGTPPVGENRFDAGASFPVTMNSPIVNGTTQYVCAGWSMTGNGPLSGTTTSFVMTITNHAVLNWLWRMSIVPAAVIPLSPMGQVTNTKRPAFQWVAVDQATWYYLLINRNGSKYLDKWVQGSNWTPTADLPAGDYEWQVRAWNSNGYGAWSVSRQFSISSLSPGMAIPLSPTGAVTGTRSPVFVWTAADRATWYVLSLNRNQASYLTKWVQTNTTWTASNLPVGVYRWWVRGWNADGYGAWSTNADFTIALAPPEACSPIAPTGTVTGIRRPAFTWTASSGATWTYLYLTKGGVKYYEKWVQGTTWTPTWDLPYGAYAWWVRPWNSDGNGPWSGRADFQLSP